MPCCRLKLLARDLDACFAVLREKCTDSCFRQLREILLHRLGKSAHDRLVLLIVELLVKFT